MARLLVLANEATAAQRRVYFHLVDATDGITAETGEAGGQPQVSSDGGAWTNTGIGTLSAIGNGRYYADLTQTLVQTTGTLIETRYKSANTAECPGDSVQVVAFDPNDTVRLGLTALPNAAADAAGGLPISDAGGLDIDAVGSAVTSGTHGNAALKTLIDTVDNFIDTEISSIITTLGVAGAGLTDLGGFSTTAKAQIQTEAEDAIVTHRLDELLNADSDIDGAAPPTVGSVFHELMSKTAGSFTFDQTTDSNEAIRDRGDAAWITATGFSTHSAADVWASATRTLTTIDEDSTTLDLDATIRAAVGLASANLDTQLTAIDDYLDTEVAAILAAVDTEIATIVTAVGTTIPNTLSGLFTTALTESYRGAGAAGSVAQYLHELIAHMGEKSIASTTLTLKKLDGSTSAKTYTLNDATTPTAITETT